MGESVPRGAKENAASRPCCTSCAGGDAGVLRGRYPWTRRLDERDGGAGRDRHEARSFDRAVTVFLGDYVDRGLGSMQVVDRLAGNEWPAPIIALAGNHEDLLLAFLNDKGVLALWRDLGGLETLHSYGVDVGRAMAGRDFEAVRAAFANRLPKHHRQFLETLKVSTTIGDYFFCHAGVRPGVPLDRQDTR